MTRIGILGSASVGQTLAKGFKAHGYEVRIASRTPEKLAAFVGDTGIPAGSLSDVAGWGELLVLCVKGTGALEALQLAGEANLRGKVVIDTTNPIAAKPPVDGVLEYFTGPNDSLLEQLQQAFPEARLVKAFSCVGNARMINPVFAVRPTMFYCGNDPAARDAVKAILIQFGWDPADMGTAVAARAIEPLCQLWCIPGFRQNYWTHAFAILWS